MHSALAPPINSEPALLPMDIYLTNHANVRNTKFCAANGQVLYKSETEGFVLSPHKKTTIYKIIPNDAPEDMGTLPHFLAFVVSLVNLLATSRQIFRIGYY